MEGKRAMVMVWNRDGTPRVALTYMVQADAAVGDRGRVEIRDPRDGSVTFFDATIQSLTTDYAGPCKPFYRTGRATPATSR